MKITLRRLGRATCALLMATAMIGSQPAHAGEDDEALPNPEVYFGGFGGLHVVVGEWDLSAIADEGVSPESGVIFGIRAGFQVTYWFGFEGEIGFVPFVIDKTDGGGLAMNWSLNTLWSPFDFKLSPYGLIGVGMYHSAYGDLGGDADWDFHWGLGLRAMLNEWAAFRIEGRHIVTDSYTEGSASNVTWTLGVDVWPWSYVGEQDTDKDGILDKDDDCPTIPGPASTRGCPDRDGDGIRDKDDRCPDLPGPAINQGCPDTDGDGIFDDVDACPTVPGVPEHKGCPPPVQDSDGDGIPDDQDKCPTVKGVKEAQGCLPTEFDKFTGAVEDINFDTNKSTLKPRSFKILDEAVKLLKQYPTIRIDIHGHTDSQGPDAYNQKLSEARANAVRQYLVDKGIGPERLTAQGFGESEPIAPNNTAAGRAKNRRTEFKIRAE